MLAYLNAYVKANMELHGEFGSVLGESGGQKSKGLKHVIVIVLMDCCWGYLCLGRAVVILIDDYNCDCGCEAFMYVMIVEICTGTCRYNNR